MVRDANKGGHVSQKHLLHEWMFLGIVHGSFFSKKNFYYCQDLIFNNKHVCSKLIKLLIERIKCIYMCVCALINNQCSVPPSQIFPLGRNHLLIDRKKFIKQIGAYLEKRRKISQCSLEVEYAYIRKFVSTTTYPWKEIKGKWSYQNWSFDCPYFNIYHFRNA